jgi:hypothetical protein
MARKHKKRRTHVEEDVQEKTGGERVPKSFVLRRYACVKIKCCGMVCFVNLEDSEFPNEWERPIQSKLSNKGCIGLLSVGPIPHGPLIHALIESPFVAGEKCQRWSGSSSRIPEE